ncbi:two-component system sporulation sensor kinase A [Paenibacillus sp. V4I3]|uniref:PAS domain S-box protein n=1 Tax=unclassified Paenibacillus TaxID=185978 RepID=UPI002786F138|nr:MULTISPECIES: PAS domain S-box protein [unclassified Paenibacillus]MDQ0875486.1 two-component system sporulation sensor kinase A [Paenibacillus sp. V4I3]MDQ0888432.1 two-component system sporulation sensor kinase A [Paenibacillus sp. V4I9]
MDMLSRTEPSFATVFEFTTMGMAIISLNGQWMKMNNSLSAITGYSEEELLYTDITTIFLPEETDKLIGLLDQLLSGDLRSVQIEQSMKSKEGTIIRVECGISLIRNSDNEPLYYMAQMKDLSRKSEMERKLAESEQRYNSLIEHNPAGILTSDLNGLIKSVNPAMERILGYTKADMVGRSIHHFWEQEELEDQAGYPTDSVLLQTDNYMLRVTHKSGEKIELGLKNVPIIVNGITEGVYIIARDITQHNKDRESLRVAQQDLHDTVRRQQGMTMKFRQMQGKFIHTLCDGELLYRLGYKPSHILGNGLYEIWPFYMATIIDKYYRRAWTGEENVMYEATFRGITYLTSLRPIFENGRVIEVIGSCVDITERKQMETELRETKELLESFINNTTDAICVLDQQFKVISVNSAYEKVFGWNQDELLNQPLPIYPDFLEEHRKEIHDLLKSGNQISGLETVRVRKDGELIHVSVTKTPIKNEKHEIIGFAGITRDITERKRTEELLRKSDKLSVAGQLAAGLAHEIRNPLTSLRGFLQLLQNDMKGKQHYFDIMLSELDRINFIVSEFLVIAKPEAIQYKRSDLINILQTVIALLDTQANLCNVQLLLEFESDIPEFICSEMHLKQLFINLVKNAIEAITKDGQIKITVSMQGSGMIRVRTQDNGCGIPEERVKQLGEPFYTTKEKGTGLGLMMCFKIVEAHKGTMSIQSQIGEGTIIDVFLPTQTIGNDMSEFE